MKLWDYLLPKRWKPQTDAEWIWFLERKINYDELRGLEPKIVKRYLPKLRIDDGKRLMMRAYFKRYGTR